ncbi:hypothetical protein X801_05135, partial [Opisthorchis viverrini]
MDTSLSPVGLSQAQDLKVHMNSLPIDVVISSDLKRASMTAEALGLSIPLELDSRLRERVGFGHFSWCASFNLTTEFRSILRGTEGRITRIRGTKCPDR